MRRFLLVSFGATTWKRRQPVSKIKQESNGIRAKSEGRRKAAIAKRNPSFCCNNLIEVAGREAIERAKVRAGETSIGGR